MERTLQAYLNKKNAKVEKIDEDKVMEASKEIWLLYVESYRCQFGEDNVWDWLADAFRHEEIAEIIKKKLS